MTPRTDTPLTRAIADARRGMSPHAFAAKCGLGATTVWRYETGRRVPTLARHINGLVAGGVPREIIAQAIREQAQQRAHRLLADAVARA